MPVFPKGTQNRTVRGTNASPATAAGLWATTSEHHFLPSPSLLPSQGSCGRQVAVLPVSVVLPAVGSGRSSIGGGIAVARPAGPGPFGQC